MRNKDLWKFSFSYKAFLISVAYFSSNKHTKNQMEGTFYYSTHSVPAIPVLIWDLSEAIKRARPKSAIFGSKLSSSKMLLAFMSLWIIFVPQPPWRYVRPSAIPQMIWNRCSQVKASAEPLSALKYRMFS